MPRFTASLALSALTFGCVLPEVTIDESLGAAGAAASGGSGASGGTGGSGGLGASGGSGGTGADLREDACINYCTIYLAACANNEANKYDNEPDCITTCYTSDWPLGTNTEANSVSCRLHHARLAQDTGLLDPHCFHSAEVPSKGNCELP